VRQNNKTMQHNIPESGQKRVLIVGAGFGGLMLADHLAKKEVQVVLVDKNNYHQFQPLFYQVATAGLEPSAISFPLRKVFHHRPNVHIRVTEVEGIDTEAQELITGLGKIRYDYLVIATGADTNYFGMENIQQHAIPMKSVSEALFLRNHILQNLENALSAESEDDLDGLLNIVVAGGGPTGVEVSGTLAEMRTTVLPKDFPELDFKRMNIYLMEGSPQVLSAMSDISSEKGKEYLEKLGVEVRLNTRVQDFDGKHVTLADGQKIRSNTLVWATGIKPNLLAGLKPETIGRGGRIKVDAYNRAEGYERIFAIGDVALMTEEKYPNGHPQMAQPAMQQGKLLADNLVKLIKGEQMKPFHYKDLGSMATVGRNLAVVELPFVKFQGFFAWLTWMFVHLMSILGVKNRFFVFLNWCWNYITYDQSLRLIIKPRKK
jgi:NADH:ubiquinone reductase (H+-translocating)